MFETVLGQSMMWKAQDKKVVEFIHHDLREYGLGPRRRVDDTPYGGGDGMLLMVEPLWKALDAAKAIAPDAKVLLMTPRGERWKQSSAQMHADSHDDLIFVCSRYEGYDERIMKRVDQAYSVGDYVLTGGELPALTMIDSIVRLIPGVLGGEKSAEIESFSDGETLEFPQYTRPEVYEDMNVPDVLIGGNHAAIAAWRQENSKKSQ